MADTFKALSLTQPWASLVALGSKKLETRSWYTSYRGPLVIHAAKGYPAWARELANTPAFRQGLGCLDPDRLPLGVGLCVVNLRACVKTSEIDKLNTIGIHPAVNEITFGNYADGRWAWALEYEYSFHHPIPAIGRQRLFNWEHEVYQVPA